MVEPVEHQLQLLEIEQSKAPENNRQRGLLQFSLTQPKVERFTAEPDLTLEELLQGP